MRFGFVGPSYTATSSTVADEELINLYVETLESQPAMVQSQQYGGRGFPQAKALFGTPGLAAFSTLAATPVRGMIYAGTRLFAVGGGQFYEVNSSGVSTNWGAVVSDSNPATFAFNGVQVLCVSAGHAYCFTLASDAFVEVTASLAGTPVKCEFSDGYFIVQLSGNKYQMSQLLDGTTWPGQLVNAVSVFADNIASIIVNHRELWVLGQTRSQVFYDSGSTEVFDPIDGALLEVGCGATYSPCRIDNSVAWLGQDERGAWTAWRSNGYTPQRISTHAVEKDLASWTNIASAVSYAYQDDGHSFWVIYVPGSTWSWTYDVGEQTWHKRASGWNGTVYQPHWSWNHAYAFGKHLVGDWNSGIIYQMSAAVLNQDGTYSFATDNGTNIRRLRRTPTIINEMEWAPIKRLTVDFETGVGPTPPLTDGGGNPRGPQAILRWSDDRGHTWSNSYTRDCGQIGKYTTRAIWNRLGRTRYRVFELSMTDPIRWVINDAYLDLAQ